MKAPLGDLHVSNALTYSSVGAALGAMAVVSLPDGRHTAGALLAAAAILDTFDGRFARLFTRSARQAAAGRELDSLADLVVFGVTPIVVARAMAGDLAGTDSSFVWWTAAFVYLIAATTRLVHFNIEEDTTRFVGVPTPAIGLIWSTALLWPMPSSASQILFLGCAAAMVLPLRIPRPGPVGLTAFAGWAVALAAAHSW